MALTPEGEKWAGAINELADALEKAHTERDAAIREAAAAGRTVREIAAACRLSASRVHQIIHNR